MGKKYMKRIGMMILAFVFYSMTVLPAQTPGKGSTGDSAKNPPAQSSSKGTTLKGKTVNINKADEAEILKNIPLITPALAKKIVKYRKDNGDFQTLEELLQIDGFDRNLLRKIKPFILLEGIGGNDCTC
jgi:competence protein ComEA